MARYSRSTRTAPRSESADKVYVFPAGIEAVYPAIFQTANRHAADIARKFTFVEASDLAPEIVDRALRAFAKRTFAADHGGGLPPGLSSWMYRVGWRLALTQKRHLSVVGEHERLAAIENGVAANSLGEATVICRLLQSIMASGPRARRDCEIFDAYIIDGTSMADLAARYGLSERSAFRAVARCAARIKQAIAERYPAAVAIAAMREPDGYRAWIDSATTGFLEPGGDRGVKYRRFWVAMAAALRQLDVI